MEYFPFIPDGPPTQQHRTIISQLHMRPFGASKGMPATSLVIYPSPGPDHSDPRFDMEYYLDTHMPMAADQWKSFGLQDWKVVQLGPASDGNKPYSVATVMSWNSLDGLKAALESDGFKVLAADVKDFTDLRPLFLTGDVVGSFVV